MQGSKSCPHKEGPNRVSTRGLMKAAGFTSEEIAQPFVGIACSWTDAFPGHNRLNQLAEDVARGVIARYADDFPHHCDLRRILRFNGGREVLAAEQGGHLRLHRV